jgi:hypothetical protein
MVKRVLLVAMSVVGAGILLILLVKLTAPGTAEQRQVRLSDGRLFRVEAVTFGTNHVVGWGDGWLVPLRKILPSAAVQFLTPTRGQSRQTTDSPTLVVWVHARDASGKYVDCQGVRASFVDDQGDVYPVNSYDNGSFSKGFGREAYLFQVFPRRSAQLKLQLAPWRSEKTSTLLIANPCRRTAVAAWTPETLPAIRRVEQVEFRLESLAIQTNGGPQSAWEPLGLHWRPVFSLSAGGAAATNWTTPEWQAEDATGNRGQTLGLHEPMLKFIATTYPQPEAVNDEARRWRLPMVRLPTSPQGVQWNTNRVLRDASVTVIGLFPPGAYTFSQGQLTNPPSPVGGRGWNGWTGLSQQVAPGRWRKWATFGTTNYTVFLRWPVSNAGQRLAVGLRDRQGPVSWTQCNGSEGADGVFALAFDTPLEAAQDVGLEMVLLEPLRAEFVVRPAVGRLPSP